MHRYQRMLNFGCGPEMIRSRRLGSGQFRVIIRSESNSGKSLSWNSKFSEEAWNSFLTGERRFSSLLTHSMRKVEFSETRRNFCSNSSGFRISDEVRDVVGSGGPVLALESAIITHGMPFPHNIETALTLQDIIRAQGATPATVGVIRGELVVGLSVEEIERLGTAIPSKDSTLKVSRRDLPIALSQKLDGGTTVSGTIVGAVKAGIPIFATGGIGGVHRGAETTFDISADLRELGRNPIAVVSAGVKSILDIGKTLEYLETEGVCVAVLKRLELETEINNDAWAKEKIADHHGHDNENDGTKRKKTGKSVQIGRVKFPSFFTAESQFTAPYLLTDELQAAHLVNSAINFKLESGILIAVPIPEEHEVEGEKIEEAISIALEKGEKAGIKGKDITPQILHEINKLTSGSSLAANKCLIENNVRVATQIAIFLAKLRRTWPQPFEPHSSSQPQSETVLKGKSESRSSSTNEVKSMQKSMKDFKEFCREGYRQGMSAGEDASMLKNPSVGTTATDNKKLVLDAFPQKLHQRCIDSSELFPRNKSMSEQSNVLDHLSWDNSTVFRQFGQGNLHRRPVVVGGSSIDLIMSIQENNVVSDGRTHSTKIRTSAGGVGRNIADALQKLGENPVLISVIGDDLFGRELTRHFKEIKMDTTNVFPMKDVSTAIYSAMLNHHGECLFGLGDMDIHSQMSEELINENCHEVIRNASIVILDGNMGVSVMTSVLRISTLYNIPGCNLIFTTVWFEPTELRKAKKILQVPKEYWGVMRFISPNLRELMSITEIDRDSNLSEGTKSSGTNNVSNFDLPHLTAMYHRCFSMFSGLQFILLTKGRDGIQIISRGNGKDSLVGEIISEAAPELVESEIKSVSGAGDCLNAGFISGILHGMTISECAIKGTHCAKKSLHSIHNVPEQF